MGFIFTTLIFIMIGIIASFCTRICCNKGPSANLFENIDPKISEFEERLFSDRTSQSLFHLTLVITATICCWMMWAIVYLAQMNPLIVPILSEGE